MYIHVLIMHMHMHIFGPGVLADKDMDLRLHSAQSIGERRPALLVEMGGGLDPSILKPKLNEWRRVCRDKSGNLLSAKYAVWSVEMHYRLVIPIPLCHLCIALSFMLQGNTILA